jgi:hypothetical protein
VSQTNLWKHFWWKLFLTFRVMLVEANKLQIKEKQQSSVRSCEEMRSSKPKIQRKKMSSREWQTRGNLIFHFLVERERVCKLFVFYQLNKFAHPQVHVWTLTHRSQLICLRLSAHAIWSLKFLLIYHGYHDATKVFLPLSILYHIK